MPCSGRSRLPLRAATLLLAGAPALTLGAPATCADVLAKIEQRLAATRVEHPPLKIVPKNLATGARVAGSCEGGTQRIVYGAASAAAPASANAAAKPPPARKTR